MSEDKISAFGQSNRSSIHYFSNFLREIDMYMHMLLELSVEHDICFNHPDSIEFAEEWMASGVIVRWMPTVGYSNKSYFPELIFIWSGNELNTIPCIRATLYKRTVNNEQPSCEIEFQMKPEENTASLTIQQAFSVFQKLNELNQEMMMSFAEGSDL
jgi:hypothetical protein